MEEGETAKCEAILNALQHLDSAQSKDKMYIEGRLLLAKREYQPALDLFQEVLKTPEGLSENVMVGADARHGGCASCPARP